MLDVCQASSKPRMRILSRQEQVQKQGIYQQHYMERGNNSLLSLFLASFLCLKIYKPAGRRMPREMITALSQKCLKYSVMYEDIIRKQHSKPHEIAPIMSRLQNIESRGMFRLVKRKIYHRQDSLTGRRNSSACHTVADMFREQATSKCTLSGLLAWFGIAVLKTSRKCAAVKTNW